MGPTPIFVLGMPRSGTTLIKQILSTHAMVLGGGELPTLGQLTDDLSSESMTFPEIVATLDDGDIERIGHEYSNALAEISENTPFAVDKMPRNFLFIGLIHLALTHAKIIHCRRDPVDTCFSCFKQIFQVLKNLPMI
jgi:hypothetical protein